MSACPMHGACHVRRDRHDVIHLHLYTVAVAARGPLSTGARYEFQQQKQSAISIYHLFTVSSSGRL